MFVIAKKTQTSRLGFLYPSSLIATKFILGVERVNDCDKSMFVRAYAIRYK